MSKIRVDDIVPVSGLNLGIGTASGSINITGDIGTASGSINITGDINATGDLHVGIDTGFFTEDLVVNGDARITGILTVGTASVTLNGNDGIISGINTVNSISFPSTGSFSNRNIVINSAMRVAQRSTLETGVTNSGYYTIDRYRLALIGLGTWTLEQSGDAPVGFSSSFKATCTTADASPAASDILYLQHRMEAQDLQHLNFGTSAAVPMTLSFWVKSNKTGDASFMMFQNDNSLKLFSTSYTINTADTWEYKTIAIPADTSGLINDDNGIGLTMGFWLNSGSDNTGGSHNTTWGTYIDANTNVSNLGVGGATSDNWLITGIQLEVGTQSTPFEHRSFGDELARCQRYYETGNWHGMYKSSDDTMGWVNYKVTKRDNPSITSIAPGGTTTNRVYYYSIDAADRGEREVNINPSSLAGGMTDFTNSFFGIISAFTPASTNDATFSGIYRADAEL